MSSYIGIDLGTTFSVVSTIDKTGRPQIVENPDNPVEYRNITPSCVEIKDETLEVGWTAYKSFDKPNVAKRFKRKMGTSETLNIGGKDYTPTDKSAAVLNKLKKVAENELGEITEAVVTVPANVANEAREATLEAAKLAGLDVKYIINEPTAAALYYAFKEGKELSGNYVVYDLGGGTFDISIIRISGQDVKVLVSNGINKLGGIDFNESLRDVVKKKYNGITGKELKMSDYNFTLAEEDKKSLSRRPKITAGGGGDIGGEFVFVKRAEFEEAISSMIAQTEMLCQSTLEEAGPEASDIKGVFLAGGSTRIPAVLQSVEKIFGQEPIAVVNVDEVVALGAALYAAYKSDGKHLSSVQKKSIEGIKFSEVTNMCYGTIALGHNEARGESLENNILIKKGEKIPCSVTKPFMTVVDGQEKANCTITESRLPETDPRFANILWEGELPLPAGRPKGQKIEVTFRYTENQIIHCSFKDVESGRVEEVNTSMGGKSNEGSEIDKFLVD